MNLYDLLNCPRKATVEQILCEYKIIIRSCHPDKGGCSKTFQDVTFAKDILTDNETRRKYDI